MNRFTPCGLLTLCLLASGIGQAMAATLRAAEDAAITAAALAGDPIALQVLEQFSCWLGRVAGNNVLTLGARGGVHARDLSGQLSGSAKRCRPWPKICLRPIPR